MNGNGKDNSLVSQLLTRVEAERNGSHTAERTLLGQVTAADTERGVTIHLRREQPVELLRQGQFVVVEGQHLRFFGTIGAFRLATTDPAVGMDPPDSSSPLIRDTLSRSTTYAECNVRLALEMVEGSVRPARTIPGPFSQSYTAGQQDYQTVFGTEDRHHFIIGSPRELDESLAAEAPICIDLRKFVERSNGIFGRSGTGKSMLARLLLCGLVKSEAAVNLIFDMHSEYATEKELEPRGTGKYAKGLRDLFGKSRVALYTMDEEDSRKRGGADGVIRIALSDITIDDIEALGSELKMSEGSAMLITARQAYRKMGRNWIERLVSMGPGELEAYCTETGANSGSVEALKRRLENIADFSFVVDSKQAVGTGIDGLIKDLRAGRHVILMFGKFRSTLAYMLVANILTKRIHDEWVRWSERHEQDREGTEAPRPLMITIEEAHKFLGRDSTTIFGTIAREMRKYLVTLMVIDQRPSGIDDEVMSQIGTRVTALLNDDKDIDAVFMGIRGGGQLKALLATLDSKQEVMVMGHAVPMEVVLRVRSFDADFYKSLTTTGPSTTPSQARTVSENIVKSEQKKASLEDLFGE
ncbi:MAG TPA: ATP-binding protein [Chloroflexia bacterium]|nr:ATP-binding protein [Chloroflexia bacterium]